MYKPIFIINNQMLLKSLFYETSKDHSKDTYTLKEQDITVDGKFYPSLYKLYMSLEDQTEYDFALSYLYSWSHWEKLCRCKWFMPIVGQWRQELHLKTVSKALKVIRAEANDTTSKNKFQANKILIDRSWEQNSPKQGRPSAKQISQEIKDRADEDSRLDDDLKRLSDAQ